MTSYTSNELISSSDIAKRFGSYLSQVTSNAVEKLAILKNNKVEAVLVSKEAYERMQAALEYIEDKEIETLIQKRLHTPHTTLSHEEMLKNLNISPEELK